jgi:uncharacterized protein with ParB-like and HNH nuclease domain
MNVEVLNIKQFLKDDLEYIIPIFQRTYSWGKEQWEQLWDDIDLLVRKTYENPNEPPEHFMGSVVTLAKGRNNEKFYLIDGQQRVTTIHLFLFALRTLVEAKKYTDLAGRISFYLQNQHPTRPKIVPSELDRDAYMLLWNKQAPSYKAEHRIFAAYDYFRQKLQKYIREFEPQEVFDVLLNNMVIIRVRLQDRDDPYSVFESLNAKGMPLSIADLIHNLLFMYAPEEKHDSLNNDYWMPLYKRLTAPALSQTGKATDSNRYITDFFFNYQMADSHTWVSKSSLYTEFKETLKKLDSSESIFPKLHRASIHYERLLNPQQEPDDQIRERLRNLSYLQITVYYPLLLNLYTYFEAGQLTKEEFLECLTMLETYLIRFILCIGKVNDGLNRLFPLMSKNLGGANMPQLLKDFLLSKKPVLVTDQRILKDGAHAELYKKINNSPICLYILASIENRLSGRDEELNLENLEIQRIAPSELTEPWRNEWGRDKISLYNELSNTIGNITLMRKDEIVSSNLSFIDKRKRYQNSSLELNRMVAKAEQWNAEAVERRAKELLKVALEVWPAFGIPEIEATRRRPSTKPVRVHLFGKGHDVQKWKEVLVVVAEEIIRQKPGYFEEIFVKKYPSYFSQNTVEIRSPYPLTNGWYLETNCSSDTVIGLSRQFLRSAGFDETGFSVDEREVR